MARAAGTTDWRNGGAGGPPRWETFEIRRLIPWIDAHFRTISAQRGRAIAGLSMGGFGTMSFASRHPDLFAWAASFSGAVDIIGNKAVPIAINAGAVQDGGQPNDQFGDRVANEINWRAHNPVDLAPNLRRMRLQLFTGNGRPGPYDSPTAGVDVIETQTDEMTKSLHARLNSLGIDHGFTDYGPGTHTWPYWQRDLRWALPDLEATFANPAPRRRHFNYRSAENHYSVYGWRVRFTPSEMRFSALRAGRRSFILAGTGTARVRTGSLYHPNTIYRLRGSGADFPRRTRSDRRGRLRISLRLDPAPGPAKVRVLRRR